MSSCPECRQAENPSMLLPILRPVLLAASALLMTALPARADFRLCNNTASRVGIAIGYRDKEGWLT